MALMDRTGVARSLEQIASYLEFKGENPFRVRAFTAAAKSVMGVPGDLDVGIADGTLAQTKGIGPAILQIVTELVNTGRAELLEELRAVPRNGRERRADRIRASDHRRRDVRVLCRCLHIAG